MTPSEIDRARYAPLVELLGWKVTSSAEWMAPWRVQMNLKLWVKGDKWSLDGPDILSADVMIQLLDFCRERGIDYRMNGYMGPAGPFCTVDLLGRAAMSAETLATAGAETPIKAVADAMLKALAAGCFGDAQ